MSKSKTKTSEKRKSDALKMLASTANCASKPATPTPPAPDGLTGAKNALIDTMHDYFDANNDQVQVSLMEEEFPPLPITPSKPPAVKQRRVEDTETAAILSQFSSLSQLINNRADALEKMVSGNSRVITEVKEAVKENATQITGLQEAFEFISADIKTVKHRVDRVESKIKEHEASHDTREKRLAHLESYSRRWNLKLYGLEEKEKQDVRKEVIQVCQALLPEAKDKLPDVVDTVHRLGPRKPTNNQPRGIIMQFTSRIYRDAIWHAAKKSSFLKNNNLKLAEDLSAEDRLKRNQLWPAVEKARKENKLAFFVGGRAFVNGTEIFPP